MSVRIAVAQRRSRLAVRHRLATPAPDVETVARDLVGLHSSDPATVFLSVRARTEGVEAKDIERALYDDRTLARILGMRRTMFVAPADTVPVIHAATTRSLAAGERERTLKLLEEAGVSKDPATWLNRVAKATLEALETHGEATAAELTKDVPELGIQIAHSRGKKYEGKIGVSTRVLFLLATEGKIVRGRPRGGWTSTQYRWAPMRTWIGADVDHLGAETAQADLARLWLERFGPGTLQDLKWWTGWTVTRTKQALAEIEAVEVDLDGATGYVLPDDGSDVPAPDPWVALLPALDPTVMGWKEREWYLGPHGPALFDRRGNAGPTVWWDGRVVGGWAQCSDGEIVYRLLEDVGSDTTAAVEEEAARAGDWLGDVRFIPRFRTPLEQELSA